MKMEMEECEFKVAKILGATDSDIENFTQDQLDELLTDTDQGLEKYYQHMKQQLSFPFQASFEEETGPLSSKDHDVNCLRLNQGMEYDDFYGILVECTEGRKKLIVALAELDVNESNENFEQIELYQIWFSLCR